ncbi:MAG: hypothetical protein JW834_04070 [Candidatus Diapherotrites archaeon]|nr:hypothetical protein [Candidatus Diapherotrites archaeon]
MKIGSILFIIVVLVMIAGGIALLYVMQAPPEEHYYLLSFSESHSEGAVAGGSIEVRGLVRNDGNAILHNIRIRVSGDAVTDNEAKVSVLNPGYSRVVVMPVKVLPAASPGTYSAEVVVSADEVDAQIKAVTFEVVEEAEVVAPSAEVGFHPSYGFAGCFSPGAGWRITTTVENTGSVGLTGVRVVMHSDSFRDKNLTMEFGGIPAGEKRNNTAYPVISASAEGIPVVVDVFSDQLNSTGKGTDFPVMKCGS